MRLPLIWWKPRLVANNCEYQRLAGIEPTFVV
jgi:hypothetical protein